jgi:hypothetical protein
MLGTVLDGVKRFPDLFGNFMDSCGEAWAARKKQVHRGNARGSSGRDFRKACQGHSADAQNRRARAANGRFERRETRGRCLWLRSSREEGAKYEVIRGGITSLRRRVN